MGRFEHTTFDGGSASGASRGGHAGMHSSGAGGGYGGGYASSGAGMHSSGAGSGYGGGYASSGAGMHSSGAGSGYGGGYGYGSSVRGYDSYGADSSGGYSDGGAYGGGMSGYGDGRGFAAGQGAPLNAELARKKRRRRLICGACCGVFLLALTLTLVSVKGLADAQFQVVSLKVGNISQNSIPVEAQVAVKSGSIGFFNLGLGAELQYAGKPLMSLRNVGIFGLGNGVASAKLDLFFDDPETLGGLIVSVLPTKEQLEAARATGNEADAVINQAAVEAIQKQLSYSFSGSASCFTFAFPIVLPFSGGGSLDPAMQKQQERDEPTKPEAPPIVDAPPPTVEVALRSVRVNENSATTLQVDVLLDVFLEIYASRKGAVSFTLPGMDVAIYNATTGNELVSISTTDISSPKRQDVTIRAIFSAEAVLEAQGAINSAVGGNAGPLDLQVEVRERAGQPTAITQSLAGKRLSLPRLDLQAAAGGEGEGDGSGSADGIGGGPSLDVGGDGTEPLVPTEPAPGTNPLADLAEQLRRVRLISVNNGAALQASVQIATTSDDLPAVAERIQLGLALSMKRADTGAQLASIPIVTPSAQCTSVPYGSPCTAELGVQLDRTGLRNLGSTIGDAMAGQQALTLLVGLTTQSQGTVLSRLLSGISFPITVNNPAAVVEEAEAPGGSAAMAIALRDVRMDITASTATSATLRVQVPNPLARNRVPLEVQSLTLPLGCAPGGGQATPTQAVAIALDTSSLNTPMLTVNMQFPSVTALSQCLSTVLTGQAASVSAGFIVGQFTTSAPFSLPTRLCRETLPAQPPDTDNQEDGDDGDTEGEVTGAPADAGPITFEVQRVKPNAKLSILRARCAFNPEVTLAMTSALPLDLRMTNLAARLSLDDDHGIGFPLRYRAQEDYPLFDITFANNVFNLPRSVVPQTVGINVQQVNAGGIETCARLAKNFLKDRTNIGLNLMNTRVNFALGQMSTPLTLNVFDVLRPQIACARDPAAAAQRNRIHSSTTATSRLLTEKDMAELEAALANGEDVTLSAKVNVDKLLRGAFK
eukprot:PLAT3489.1.p1 GENE.PLAT3489.1~~PLAT3489.1.p1  ORF type:complete len:1047 (+),score=568.41 PLAT3489.1:86-3226(+)